MIEKLKTAVSLLRSRNFTESEKDEAYALLQRHFSLPSQAPDGAKGDLFDRIMDGAVTLDQILNTSHFGTERYVRIQHVGKVLGSSTPTESPTGRESDFTPIIDQLEHEAQHDLKQVGMTPRTNFKGSQEDHDNQLRASAELKRKASRVLRSANPDQPRVCEWTPEYTSSEDDGHYSKSRTGAFTVGCTGELVDFGAESFCQYCGKSTALPTQTENEDE